jgi:hypothetical protein
VCGQFYESPLKIDDNQDADILSNDSDDEETPENNQATAQQNYNPIVWEGVESSLWIKAGLTWKGDYNDFEPIG